MYSAKEIAKYIVWRETRLYRGVNNLRLQKLLYFIQAQFLVNVGEPCFDDTMEAWDFGPVVPSVYHEYKYFGSSSIPASYAKTEPTIYEDDAVLIDHMLNRCAAYSTTQLMAITQLQTPWVNARLRSPKCVISNKEIQDFFME